MNSHCSFKIKFYVFKWLEARHFYMLQIFIQCIFFIINN